MRYDAPMSMLFRLASLGFWLLVACIIYQVIFVAMAWAATHMTDPPVCQVGYAFPIPFASCPGLQLGLQVDFAMALPGAVIALLFILPGLLQSASGEIEAFALIPVAIYLLAALHVARVLAARTRNR